MKHLKHIFTLFIVQKKTCIGLISAGTEKALGV